MTTLRSGFASIVATAMLVASMSAFAAADEMRLFTDSSGHYSVQLPNAWERHNDPNLAAFVATPHGAQLPGIRIVVTPLAAGSNLDKVIVAAKEEFKSIWTVDEQKPTKLDEKPAVRLEVTRKTRTGATHLTKIFAIADNNVYTVTLYSEGDGTQSRPTLDKVLASFKIAPKPAKK